MVGVIVRRETERQREQALNGGRDQSNTAASHRVQGLLATNHEKLERLQDRILSWILQRENREWPRHPDFELLVSRL